MGAAGIQHPPRVPALRRSEPKLAALRALLQAAPEAVFSAEQLSTASRVVNMWSTDVAHAVNTRRSAHLWCMLCVSARLPFVEVRTCLASRKLQNRFGAEQPASHLAEVLGAARPLELGSTSLPSPGQLRSGSAPDDRSKWEGSGS